MKIVNTSLNQAEAVEQLLEEFNETFEALGLTQRLDANNNLSEALNEFFETQQVITDYAFAKNPLHKDLFEKFEHAHLEVEGIYKMLIMSHVEELRYQQDLHKLQEAFKAYVKQRYEDFMCQIQANFTEADEEAIAAKLKQPFHG